MPRRILIGKILKGFEKTVTVKVERSYKHRLGKIVRSSKNYAVHDPENLFMSGKLLVGDIVNIVESRPFSKQKKWILQQSEVENN